MSSHIQAAPAQGTGVTDPLAEEILAKNKHYNSELSIWKPDWQCLSDYLLPRKSQINDTRTPGIDDYTQDIYDTEGPWSAKVLASGQLDFTMSGVFFENLSPDENADEDAKQWYRKTGEKMLDLMQASNLFTVAHEALLQRGIFGTGHLHIEADPDDVFFAISEDIGTYSIDVNHKGKIDTVYVEKKFTVKQLVDMFGEDKVAPAVKELWNQEGGKGRGKLVTYVYAIEPRPNKDRKPGKIDGKNKPIRAVHVDADNRHIMREGGFDEMPDIVTRFLLWNLFEKYGYGAGYEAIPEVRGVNFMTKVQHAVAERKATPAILVGHDQEDDIDLRPAGKTIVNSKDPKAWPRTWLNDGDYATAKDDADEVRARIRRAFFVDLFQLLTNQRELTREKTAFEVAQMLAEQVRNFSPTFSQLKEDFINPLLERIFSICLRAGVFPEAPDSVLVETVDGAAIPTPKVNHIGKIAMLIKSIENENWMQFLTMAAPIIQMDPKMFEQKFNIGRSLVTMADNLGVPSDFRNTPEEEEAVIRRQEEDARALAAAEAAQQASEIAKNVGQAPEELKQQLPAIF